MIQSMRSEGEGDGNSDLDSWSLGQRWGLQDAADAFANTKDPLAAPAYCKQPLMTEEPLMGIMMGIRPSERRREHARLVRAQRTAFQRETRRLYRAWVELPRLITKSAAELVDAA